MGYRDLVRPALYLTLGVAVLIGVGPAWGQSVTDGKLTGTVYLPTGEALAGATARVTGPALVEGERVVVSGDAGRFVFLSLPPGTYNLTVSLDGFKTYTEEGIAVERGATFDVTVNMEIGAVEDEIVVTAETPVINKHSATIDTTFADALLKVVPTGRDTFYDLALTAPGMANVGAQGEKGWLKSPSAYGGSGNENIFLVNGVDTTNPRGAAYGALVNVNYNTIEEVKVLSLGSRAEYGSFSGAAMDVITKSGGNEFHGDVAYYSQPSKADDNQETFPECGQHSGFICAVNSDVLSTRIEDSWEANLTLGGPIKKDRLWFYAGYAHIDSETDTPLFIPLQGYTADLYDLKLTASLGVNHRLWIGYHVEDSENANESWGDTWDPEMAFLQRTDNETWSAQYQWVVTEANLFSFKFLGFDTKQNPTTNFWGYPGYVNWWKFVGSQDIGVEGGFPYVEKQVAERSTLQVDFSHYADDFLGEHDVKFGVQYTEAEGNWQGGYFHNTLNYAYPYPYQNDTPATDWWWNCDATWCWGTDEDPLVGWYNIRSELDPALTVRKSDSTGAFVDDTWIVSDRVTLNLGLRYDRATARYGEGAVYEPYEGPGDIENPTFLRSREGSGDLYDFKTWAPRLGIVWTMTEDGKTVLRGHLGRYFAPMGVESLTRFGPDMPQRHNYYEWYDIMLSEVDLNGNGYLDSEEVWYGTRLLQGRDPVYVNDEGLSDPSWDLEVAPGTDNTYTDQFNLSIQRQLGRDVALELSYVYKKTDDLIVLQPYNEATGEYWEWEQIPYTTTTGQQTQVSQIVLRDYDGSGAVDFDDVMFVLDNTHYRAINAQKFAGQDVDRTYQGIQLTLNKRYSNRWQMLASINYTDSDGFAPRQIDQDWYIGGPVANDTRAGTSPNHFTNNLEGPLLMTPEWMFKLAGSYRIPVIETDLGVRVRYDSGRPVFQIEELPTYRTWMSDFQEGVFLSTGSHDFMVSDDPNDPDWTPSTTIIDLSLNKSFRLGDVGDLAISLDTLNATNEGTPSRVGFDSADYGRVYAVVFPRRYRVGVKFSF